jgi:hypothetical protein
MAEQGGFIIDESADEAQRQALTTIFGGRAGGWPGLFAENFDDLKTWRIDIPGKATGSTELLAGPTTTPGTRLAVWNAPGAEVAPARGRRPYGTCDYTVNVFGFRDRALRPLEQADPVRVVERVRVLALHALRLHRAGLHPRAIALHPAGLH